MSRAALLVLTLSACTLDSEPLCTDNWLPVDLDSPAGLRQETVDTEDRELSLNLWYPTDDADGDAAFHMDIVRDRGSWVDASYAEPARCKHPLVVFSHDANSFGGEASSVLRQFVRMGWVAVAPDHPGDTLRDQGWPDGPELALRRVQDVRAAIDALEQLPEDDPLFGRIATDQVLVVGVGAGARTSWLSAGPTLDPEAIAASCDGACTPEEEQAYQSLERDPRVLAAAPVAGNLHTELATEASFATIDVPVLYLTGSADFDGTPWIDWYDQTPDLTWADVDGACWHSFTDHPIPCNSLAKSEGLEVTSKLLTAFGATTVSQGVRIGVRP